EEKQVVRTGVAAEALPELHALLFEERRGVGGQRDFAADPTVLLLDPGEALVPAAVLVLLAAAARARGVARPSASRHAFLPTERWPVPLYLCAGNLPPRCRSPPGQLPRCGAAEGAAVAAGSASCRVASTAACRSAAATSPSTSSGLVTPAGPFRATCV